MRVLSSFLWPVYIELKSPLYVRIIYYTYMSVLSSSYRCNNPVLLKWMCPMDNWQSDTIEIFTLRSHSINFRKHWGLFVIRCECYSCVLIYSYSMTLFVSWAPEELCPKNMHCITHRRRNTFKSKWAKQLRLSIAESTKWLSCQTSELVSWREQ